MADEELEDEEPSAPFWMATFSDMATLLLTFFVMIVAMSEVEVKKFKAALSYFQGNTGFLDNVAVVPPTVDPVMLRRPQQQQMARAQKVEDIEETVKELELQDKVKISVSEHGVHVTLTDSIMFRSGDSDLLPPSRALLGDVATKLAGEVESIIVEGHTDNRPIRSIRYPSNWELSTARAASVVRFLLTLEAALPAERYMPAGYGEFRPIASNDTGEGRSRNRRVEILFSWDEWKTPTTPLQPMALPIEVDVSDPQPDAAAPEQDDPASSTNAPASQQDAPASSQDDAANQ